MNEDINNTSLNLNVTLKRNNELLYGKVNHVDRRLIGKNALARKEIKNDRYLILSADCPELNGKILCVWGESEDLNDIPLYYTYNTILAAIDAHLAFEKLINKINAINLDKKQEKNKKYKNVFFL